MAVMRDLDAVVLHAFVRPWQVHYHDYLASAAGPEPAEVVGFVHAEQMVEVQSKLATFPLAILERPDPPPFLQPGHEPGRIEPRVGEGQAGFLGLMIIMWDPDTRHPLSVRQVLRPPKGLEGQAALYAQRGDLSECGVRRATMEADNG